MEPFTSCTHTTLINHPKKSHGLRISCVTRTIMVLSALRIISEVYHSSSNVTSAAGSARMALNALVGFLISRFIFNLRQTQDGRNDDTAGTELVSFSDTLNDTTYSMQFRTGVQLMSEPWSSHDEQSVPDNHEGLSTIHGTE